jgi:hypothetical protein
MYSPVCSRRVNVFIPVMATVWQAGLPPGQYPIRGRGLESELSHSDPLPGPSSGSLTSS